MGDGEVFKLDSIISLINNEKGTHQNFTAMLQSLACVIMLIAKPLGLPI